MKLVSPMTLSSPEEHHFQCPKLLAPVGCFRTASPPVVGLFAFQFPVGWSLASPVDLHLLSSPYYLLSVQIQKEFQINDIQLFKFKYYSNNYMYMKRKT
ncbi:hypothetical protein IC582_018632 [Cucumis melo]